MKGIDLKRSPAIESLQTGWLDAIARAAPITVYEPDPSTRLVLTVSEVTGSPRLHQEEFRPDSHGESAWVQVDVHRSALENAIIAAVANESIGGSQ